MALISTTNKDILTKRIATYAAAGAIVLATFATSVGVYNGIKTRPERRQHRMEARHLRVNARQVERALRYNDLNLAQEYMNNFQPDKDLTSANYIKFKTELEQGLVLEDINRNSAAGREDSARLILSSHSNLWTLAEKASIINSISEQSEEGRFNNLLYVSEPSSKINLCKEYISVFPKGKHLGDVTSYLVETELNSLVAQNPSMTLDQKRAKLVQLNEFLELYKNNGAKLEKILVDEAWNKLKSDTVTYLQAANSGELSLDMTVTIENGSSSNYPGYYFSERKKSIPEGSFGKVVAISDEDVSVRFDNIDKFYWSQNWDNMSQYWKDGKQNVADFKISEVYIGIKKLTPVEETIINKELDKTKNLLEKYYIFSK